MAYDRISPIGPDRLDVLMARFMWLYAESRRNPKKQRKPFDAHEFMPKWGAKRDSEDGEPWQKLKMKAEMITWLFRNDGKEEG